MNEEPIRDPKVINDLFDEYNDQKCANGIFIYFILLLLLLLIFVLLFFL